VENGVTADAQRLRKLLAVSAASIRELARASSVHLVGVIGSVARGDATPESDIDLLIQADKDVTLLDLIRLRRRLVAMLGVPVDLVDLSERADDIENLEAEVLRLWP